MTLECAGNGRAFFEPPVAGVQWEKGAVGYRRMAMAYDWALTFSPARAFGQRRGICGWMALRSRHRSRARLHPQPAARKGARLRDVARLPDERRGADGAARVSGAGGGARLGKAPTR